MRATTRLDARTRVGSPTKSSLLSASRRALVSATVAETGTSSFPVDGGDDDTSSVTVVALRAGAAAELGDGAAGFWCLHVLSGRLRIVGARSVLRAYPGDLVSATCAARAVAESPASYLLVTTSQPVAVAT